MFRIWTLRGIVALALFMLGFAVSTAMFTNGRNLVSEKKYQHVLNKPLLVSSGEMPEQVGILPIGTTMEYVRGYPEGFTRYRVYVNVEKQPLSLESMTPDDLIDPLTVSPPSSNLSNRPSTFEIMSVIKSLGLTAEDLRLIIAQLEHDE